MLRLLVGTSLMLCVLPHVFAEVKTSSSEAICLTLGKVASATVDIRKLGASEEDAMKIINDPKSNPQARRIRGQVVQYVYTMQLGSGDAQEIVYLKCKAGDFDN